MVQNASCKGFQDLLKLRSREDVSVKILENWLVTDLVELLSSISPEKRRDVVEYIQNHTTEFDEAVNQVFSTKPELKNPLLDLVDMLNGSQAILLIEKSVRDENLQIRKRGLQAAYRTRIDSLNTDISEILSDREEDFEVRKWALHILGSTDPEYYSSQIIKLARDKSEDVNIRKEGIFALTQIVTDKTLGTLCTLLGNNDVEIRQAASWALSNIGSSETINCLLAALDDEDEKVRDWAIRGLRDMDDARALQGLADAIHTSPPKEQVRMIRLVIERKSEVILRAIVELLFSEDIHVRRTAAWGLSVSPYPPAVPSLKELLNDDDEEVRDYARIALIRGGGLDPSDLRL